MAYTNTFKSCLLRLLSTSLQLPSHPQNGRTVVSLWFPIQIFWHVLHQSNTAESSLARPKGGQRPASAVQRERERDIYIYTLVQNNAEMVWLRGSFCMWEYIGTNVHDNEFHWWVWVSAKIPAALPTLKCLQANLSSTANQFTSGDFSGRNGVYVLGFLTSRRTCPFLPGFSFVLILN